jgi:class 3 adenylate cyclase
VADGSPIRYARNGDVSIAYRVDGSGPIDLLFLGGFVGNLDVLNSWPLGARFFARLTRFARVIQFDKRNQGLSDPGRYTLEDVASDAVAVLDDAGVERVSLLGLSEGGGAATLLAATRPDRIGAMAQYGSWARLSRTDGYPEGLEVGDIRRHWRRMLANWGSADAMTIFAPSIADDPEQREWWARLMRSGASPASAETLVDTYLDADVRPLLGSVAVPSLVLWRRDDLVVPAAISRVVAAGIPGCESVELAGRDHFFLAGNQDDILEPVEEFFTGRPAAKPSERVLTTVLFVDIVDSTRTAAGLGDSAWRALLTSFDERSSAAVAAGRGRRVKSTGDGILATFDGPSQAARTALTIAELAQAEGIATRAGVHTGECELIGDDIGGIAVHIASRIEAAASPGEVLASRTVRDLSIGSELTFAERGSRELKGVPGEWELFAVAAG